MNATATVLTLAIQAQVPALLWGAPGTGKTSFIRAVADALDLPIEVVIASIREPSDFGGLPIIVGHGVKLAPPEWARRLAEIGRGIAFFDEISTAAPANQAALLRVIFDKVAGDQPLPNIAMAAAANPPEQAAGGWELSPPLANRFWHGVWTLDASSWVDGMIGGWPPPAITRLPATWEAMTPAIDALVASFIRVRPSHLLNVPESASDAGRAWPSPRTWAMASRLLAAVEAAGHDRMGDVAALSVGGCIGSPTAIEFFAFLKDLDLPDPEELLADPERWDPPKRSDRTFAALASVAAAVVRNPTKERWTAGWRLMAITAKKGAKDVAAAASSSLIKLARQRPDLPLPVSELKAFVPLLQAAGMLPKGA